MSTSGDPRRSSAAPEMALAGYLYKKTRDGRMQKRYFETQGFYLTYYKTRKTDKLLAALSLPQVGDIHLVDDEDGEEGMFALELNTRVYTLKANDRKTAEVWVNTLKGLREQGRNNPQQGNAPAPVNPDVGGAIDTQRKPSPAATQDAQWLKKKNKAAGCCGFFG